MECYNFVPFCNKTADSYLDCMTPMCIVFVNKESSINQCLPCFHDPAAFKDPPTYPSGCEWLVVITFFIEGCLIYRGPVSPHKMKFIFFFGDSKSGFWDNLSEFSLTISELWDTVTTLTHYLTILAYYLSQKKNNISFILDGLFRPSYKNVVSYIYNKASQVISTIYYVDIDVEQVKCSRKDTCPITLPIYLRHQKGNVRLALLDILTYLMMIIQTFLWWGLDLTLCRCISIGRNHEYFFSCNSIFTFCNSRKLKAVEKVPRWKVYGVDGFITRLIESTGDSSPPPPTSLLHIFDRRTQWRSEQPHQQDVTQESNIFAARKWRSCPYLHHV